jgi:hypothetical protein
MRPSATGVHELEVAGVEAEGDAGGVPASGDPVGVPALVVLHVAGAEVALGVGIVELPEDLARALVQDVPEDVEPAAMGHADLDQARAVVHGLLDHQVEQRDQALRALEREALRAEELLPDELLEDHGVGQPAQDPELLLPRQLDPILPCPPCGPSASPSREGRRCA